MIEGSDEDGVEDPLACVATGPKLNISVGSSDLAVAAQEEYAGKGEKCRRDVNERHDHFRTIDAEK